MDLDVDLDDLQPDEFLDGGVDGGADLVRQGMQGCAVDRHEVDVDGHLGFADFRADAGGVVRAADGVADGPEGAGRAGSQGVDAGNRAGGDAGDLRDGGFGNDGPAGARRCGSRHGDRPEALVRRRADLRARQPGRGTGTG